MFDSFAFPHGFMSPFFFPYSPMTHHSPLPHAHWLKIFDFKLPPALSKLLAAIYNYNEQRFTQEWGGGCPSLRVLPLQRRKCRSWSGPDMCTAHRKNRSYSLYNLQLTKTTTAEGETSKRQSNEYRLTLHIIGTIRASESYLCPGLQLKLRETTETKWYRNEIYPNSISSKLFSFLFPWEKCKQRNGNMFPIDENKVHTRDIINYIEWNQDVKTHELIRNIIC